MPKGDRRRKAAGCFFKPGNTYGKLRKTHQEVSVASSSQDLLELHQEAGYTLRQRQPEAEKQEEHEFRGNRIIDLQRFLDILNVLSNEHSKRKCKKVVWSFMKEVKYGLGSKLRFKCLNCGFTSCEVKTYTEISNTKRAAINTNLAMTLMDTPMSVSRAGYLFTQLDLPFPAESHLYNITKEVRDKSTGINSEDMAEKRAMVEDHNRQQCLLDPKQLDVSTDARYSKHRKSPSYKHGLSSTTRK